MVNKTSMFRRVGASPALAFIRTISLLLWAGQHRDPFFASAGPVFSCDKRAPLRPAAATTAPPPTGRGSASSTPTQSAPPRQRAAPATSTGPAAAPVGPDVLPPSVSPSDAFPTKSVASFTMSLADILPPGKLDGIKLDGKLDVKSKFLDPIPPPPPVPTLPGRFGCNRGGDRSVSDQGQVGSCWAHAIANSIISMSRGALDYDKRVSPTSTLAGDGNENSAHTAVLEWIVRDIIGSVSCKKNQYPDILQRFGMELRTTSSFTELEKHMNGAEFPTSSAFIVWHAASARLFYTGLADGAGGVVEARIAAAEEEGKTASPASLIINAKHVEDQDLLAVNKFNPSDWAGHEPNAHNPTECCDTWWRNHDPWGAKENCEQACAAGSWGWNQCRHTCEQHCSYLHEEDVVKADRWNPGWGSSPAKRCAEWWVEEWGAEQNCDACNVGSWAESECPATCHRHCGLGKSAGHALEISGAWKKLYGHSQVMRLRNSWGSWGDRGSLSLTASAMKAMNNSSPPYFLISWNSEAREKLKAMKEQGPQGATIHNYSVIFSFAQEMVHRELRRLLRAGMSTSQEQTSSGITAETEDRALVRSATEKKLLQLGYRAGCVASMDSWNPGWPGDPSPRAVCGEWWGNGAWGADKNPAAWKKPGDKCASHCGPQADPWARRNCGGTCARNCDGKPPNKNTWNVSGPGGNPTADCEQWWANPWGANGSCEDCMMKVSGGTKGAQGQTGASGRKWGCKECAETCFKYCGDGKSLQGLASASVFRILATTSKGGAVASS